LLNRLNAKEPLDKLVDKVGVGAIQMWIIRNRDLPCVPEAAIAKKNPDELGQGDTMFWLLDRFPRYDPPFLSKVRVTAQAGLDS